MSCKFKQPHQKKVIWLNWWDPVSLNHYSSRFVGNRSCGRWESMFLICYVTSCDQVIKDDMTLRVGALTLSDHRAKFDAYKILWKWWYNVFILSCNLIWSYNQRYIFLSSLFLAFTCKSRRFGNPGLFFVCRTFLEYWRIWRKKIFCIYLQTDTVQLSVSIKGNVSGPFFFWICRNKWKFPRDYFINEVPVYLHISLSKASHCESYPV